jgi:uncharacterized membrane protein YfcA
MDAVLMLGLFLLSVAAGLIGSVFGLGGGIIIVPVLTILYGMDVKAAAAVSLVAIIAISSVTASSLVRNRAANVRVGLRLEIGAAAGAIVGAAIALYMESWLIAICFAGVLIYSAAYMFLRPERTISPDLSEKEEHHVYHDTKTGEDVKYTVHNMRAGTMGFIAAGITSALSGVGGGTIKVPIMNVHMHMPIKAATATSSFVIGITALSGAAVYLLNGVLDAHMQTVAVVVMGAIVGSLAGLRILPKINASSMRRYFSVILMVLASLMILNAGGFL